MTMVSNDGARKINQGELKEGWADIVRVEWAEIARVT